MSQTTVIEYSGKKLLAIMIVAGVAFSGMTFFMLNDEFTTSLFSEKNYEMLCDTGLCFNPNTATFPSGYLFNKVMNLIHEL